MRKWRLITKFLLPKKKKTRKKFRTVGEHVTFSLLSIFTVLGTMYVCGYMYTSPTCFLFLSSVLDKNESSPNAGPIRFSFIVGVLDNRLDVHESDKTPSLFIR